MTLFIAGVVLAGGASRRMGGGDKPLHLLGGRSILAHILARLALEHADIAISANGDPARFADFGRPILPDETRDQGPLAGILAGLGWAETLGAAHLLTVPGDSPFLPPDLARQLAPAPALARSDGRRHPTVALWPVTAAGDLRAYLARLDPDDHRAHSVIAFARGLGARTVDFPVQPIDPFFNINTPQDLARAESLFAC